MKNKKLVKIIERYILANDELKRAFVNEEEEEKEVEKK